MMDRDRELRSHERHSHAGDAVAVPFVRPRGATPPLDREVPRRAVDADERLPLPPPVTAALDDAAPSAVVHTLPDVERARRLEAQQLAQASMVSPGRARLEYMGFLDAHGVHSEGWASTHGANASGFLESQGADAPGWLASLDARRQAALRQGWQVNTPRDMR